MDNELIKISGEIKNYIYETTESMYKVVKIISDDEEITITGAFPHLDEGLVYDFLDIIRKILNMVSSSLFNLILRVNHIQLMD